MLVTRHVAVISWSWAQPTRVGATPICKVSCLAGHPGEWVQASRCIDAGHASLSVASDNGGIDIDKVLGGGVRWFKWNSYQRENCLGLTQILNSDG
ncbi:hypothetical protein Acr_13g0004610 [Actinidia rufa]|uniref:Uncharacterized protein n=1 Tax=Actinidia rufa TaxID=165716 RepID=A0A7J0FK43_9ERIC|nr:hypothetical protein Acr_13g0004610 [Actinidia rufa]